MQNTGYFNGHGGTSTSDYFLKSTTDRASAVDVYFETVSSVKKMYFMDGTTKKYIVAYKNNTYCNIGVRTEEELSEMTIYDWQFDANGHPQAYFADGATPEMYGLGLKAGQTFTTFGMNKYSEVNRFALFEYTAESFAKEFLTQIDCHDGSGSTAPGFSDGYSWTDLKNIFNAMDSSEQEVLQIASANKDSKNIVEQAMARYNYLVVKYGTSTYENFISRTLVPISNNNLIPTSISSDAKNYLGIIIIVVASVSMLSFSIIYLEKKKHH